jgi:hypothetical protein
MSSFRLGRRAIPDLPPPTPDLSSLGSCPAIIGGKRGVGQSAELGQSRSRRGWLDADVIIDGIAEPLFAAKIPFSCLDAHVTE